MKIPKMNDRLARVQIGRDKEVPIETDSSLWLLWFIDEDWDSDTVANWRSYIDKLHLTKFIFCIWHGRRRTNLFLMDKNKLIKRLLKLYKKR